MSARPGGSRRLERPGRARSPRSAEPRSTEPRNRIPAGGFSWNQIAVPVLLVVIVVAASLAAQGRTHDSAAPTSSSSVTLSRVLSCVQDRTNGKPLYQSSSRSGTVPASTTGYSTCAGRVAFQPHAASNGYATQWTHGNGWFAARGCPEPGDDWWFVGAGAGISHRSFLTLDNPRANDANVTITVFGPKGQVDAPGLNGLLVPAGQSLAIDMERVAPALGDLTVHVSVTRGLVAASMWERWAQSPLTKSVSTWVPSASTPAKRVQLVGVPGKPNQSTLLLTNPRLVSAFVQVKLVNASATFTPTKNSTVTVPPQSTVAVPTDNLAKLGVGSVLVTSSSPITAGLRSVQGNAEAYATPALSIGAQSTVGLPGGVPSALVLTAPTASTIEVTAIGAHNKVVLTKSVNVVGGMTATLALPKTAIALRLDGVRRGSASGAVVISNNGITVIDVVPTANAARVPSVVAEPY